MKKFIRPYNRRTFCFQRILFHFRLRDIHDSMHVERDLLGVRRPSLVAEAVVVFSVGLGSEGIVVRRDRLLVILTVRQRVLELDKGKARQSLACLCLTLLRAKRKGGILPLPRNQYQGSHCHRIPCRQLGNWRSSDHLYADFRESIPSSAPWVGCCVLSRRWSSPARWWER